MTSISTTGDGRLLLTGDSAGVVRLWERETGRELRSFSAGAAGWGGVGAAISSDGRRIATLALANQGAYTVNDNRVRLWDSETGEVLWSARPLYNTLEGRLSFTPDNQFLVVQSAADLALLSADDGRTIWEQRLPGFLQKHALTVTGDTLVVIDDCRVESDTDEEPRAVFLETATGRLLSVEPMSRLLETGEPASSDRAVSAFSPDGLCLLATNPLRVMPWTARLGPAMEAATDTLDVATVTYVGADRLILSTGGRVLSELDRHQGTVHRTYGGKIAAVHAAQLDPSGEQILVATPDEVVLWSLRTGRPVRRIRPGYSLRVAAFSPDGTRVLTAGASATADLWSASTGERLVELNTPGGATAAAFVWQGRGVAVSAGADQDDYGIPSEILLFSARTGELRRTFAIGSAYSLATSPDGEFVAFGGGGAVPRILALESGTVTAVETPPSLLLHDNLICCYHQQFAFSPDGQWFIGATTTSGGIYPLRTDSSAIAVLPPKGSPGEDPNDHSLDDVVGIYAPLSATAVAVAPDSRRFAVGRSNSALHVYDIPNGYFRMTAAGHQAQISALSYSPDGSLLLSGSADGTVRLWSTRSGAEVARLVTFQNDGWVVVTPSGRFDANDSGRLEALHWVVAEDPLTPLPLEMYGGDSFEPGLLGRVLEEEPSAR